MEIAVKVKLVVTFIAINCAYVWTEKENDDISDAYVWTAKENDDISERLSSLEDMLTEMEKIVRETDVKVNKARNKLKDTEETLKRDFSRLEHSTKRKIRKYYRMIMKEVRKELKHDSHLLNEMFRSIKHIPLLRKSENKSREVADTHDRLIRMHGQKNKGLHQDIAEKNEVRIMFKAVQLNKRIYSDGETIVFPKVLTNIGDGYDPKYGLFVTPLAGTYYFTVQLYILSGKALDIGIYVDDKCIAWAKLSPRQDSCENVAVVANLSLGDVVYVKQKTQALSDTYKVGSNELFNSFSGVLIR